MTTRRWFCLVGASLVVAFSGCNSGSSTNSDASDGTNTGDIAGDANADGAADAVSDGVSDAAGDAVLDGQSDASGDAPAGDLVGDISGDMAADMVATPELCANGIDDDGDGDIDCDDADCSTDPVACPTDCDWPSDVNVIQLDPASGYSATHNFSMGADLANTDWTHAAEVACIKNPIEAEFFGSNNVMFALEGLNVESLPPWSEITVTVTPSANNVETNPYILLEGENQCDTPPSVTDVEFCYVPETLPGPGAANTVTFRTYHEGPNRVLVGIANRGRWAADDDGDFQLDISFRPLNTPMDRCYDDVIEPGQYAPHVDEIALDPNGRATLRGTLADGAWVCDQTYLNDAFCVPTTQFSAFAGRHHLYAIEGGVPADSYVTLTLTPDPGVDLNIYGAQQGIGDFYFPPNYPLGICEAGLTWPTGNPGQPESINFFTGNGDKNIQFAVTGPAGSPMAGYTVDIEVLNTSTDNCTDADYAAVQGLSDWPASVTTIAVDGSGYGSAAGDLSAGLPPLCTLDWAANSSVACFPLVETEHFSGNVQYFALETPPGPATQVTWTVTPDPAVDVNIAGYRHGTSTYYVPPFVPSVLNCEASYPFSLSNDPDPGVIEVIEFFNPSQNQYNYFLAVFGYEGGMYDGNYTVEVQIVDPPPPHCPGSLPGATYTAWPGNVNLIDVDMTGSGSATGDLADGSCMNLDFANTSQVACFPATRNDRYEGNHVFYALDQPIPPRSEVTITVTPQAGVDVNLYGLQAGVTSYPVPPAISTGICEASYGLSGANPGVAESLYFANPSETNSYNIMFAVAGADMNGASGAYDIDVQVNTSVVHCAQSLPGDTGLTDWPAGVTVATLTNNEWSTTEDLGGGDCVNLDFADDSDIACFPATENDKFDGNHDYYALGQTLPPNSVLTINAVPDPGVDISLYGFQMGSTAYQVPPAVTSTICEASYGLGPDNPGETESISFYNPTGNSYNIFFAVAGAGGATTGGYTISAHLSTATTHCPGSLPGQSYTSWPTSVNRVDASSGSAQVMGDLADGDCVNLGWAENSSVACYPATLFSSFEGPHVYYVLDGVIDGQTATITATSTGGTPVQVYGYTVGPDTYFVPPYTPTVVACEYEESAMNTAEISLVSTTNPYQVFFAVAGAAGATSGTYTVDVTIN